MPTRDVHIVGQAAAGFVAQNAAERAEEVAAALTAQDGAFKGAMAWIDGVRAFVGSPEHILGNPQTKHGEIAEQVEVAVRNARDLVAQHIPTATFDGVGRLDPTDYRIVGDDVQSKFINGVGRTLDHVRAHMRDYPGYGSKASFYHIPSDQHDVVQRALTGGPVDGLSERSIRAIAEKAREIEEATGRPFGDAVRPSVSRYGDVQQGRIHETMDQHEGEVRSTNRAQRADARAAGEATLGDVAGAAARGAVVGAGVRVTATIYRKWKAGKNPFRGGFTSEDWKELGIDGAKGGAQGGVAAGTIFALTQYTDLAAPFAGAVVSSAMAFGEIAGAYRRGEIGFEEMVELGELACAEAALVGAASALGQAIIPIPVLGALVGAIAGRLVASHGRRWLDASDKRLAQALDARFADVLSALDRDLRATLSGLLAAFDRLGDLTDAAFDVGRNTTLRLAASLRLAEAHGVASDRVIRDVDEMDRFMMG